MASYEQAKSLLVTGPSRPTLYSVSMFANNKRIANEYGDYLKLFCSRILVPGIEYDRTAVIGQESHGVYRDQPVAMRFSGGNLMSMDCIVDSQFGIYDSIRQLFEMCAVGSNPSASKGSRTQRMNYYNSYIFNMQVDKLEFTPTPSQERLSQNDKVMDKDGIDAGYKRVARFLFEKCYIRDMSSMTLDSGAYNEYLSFNTNVSYETYEHVPLKKIEGVLDDE